MDIRIEPESPALWADSLPSELPGKPRPLDLEPYYQWSQWTGCEQMGDGGLMISTQDSLALYQKAKEQEPIR